MKPIERKIEHVAFAMCRAANHCTSIAHEVMKEPSYLPGREGDAGSRTLAGYFREQAAVALSAAYDWETEIEPYCAQKPGMITPEEWKKVRPIIFAFIVLGVSMMVFG